MDITLNPESQKFIDDQIRSGRFRSANELLDAAVQRMMLDSDDQLDDAAAAAINRAEDQIDRGEGIDFDKFAAEMRKRIASR
jgi:putative addiction module CopG family antidote